MNGKKTVQKWINNCLNDSVVKKLSEMSHLSKIQLETLIIDVLAENLSMRKLKYEEKAILRLNKTKISRGSFNRTLKQAKNNVSKAIYTILLLGYIGIFESVKLDPFIEISNKLANYIEAYKTIDNKEHNKEQIKTINAIKSELEDALKSFNF